jgi:hypothetical protein
MRRFQSDSWWRRASAQRAAEPNNRLQLTASSVRYASASGSS